MVLLSSSSTAALCGRRRQAALPPPALPFPPIPREDRARDAVALFSSPHSQHLSLSLPGSKSRTRNPSSRSSSNRRRSGEPRASPSSSTALPCSPLSPSGWNRAWKAGISAGIRILPNSGRRVHGQSRRRWATSDLPNHLIALLVSYSSFSCPPFVPLLPGFIRRRAPPFAAAPPHAGEAPVTLWSRAPLPRVPLGLLFHHMPVHSHLVHPNSRIGNRLWIGEFDEVMVMSWLHHNSR